MISSLLEKAQEFGRNIITTENCSNRTCWKTRTTIDALIWMNKKLIVTLVNAIAWTDIHAGRIFGSDTRLGNHREVIHGLEYGRANRACP
jgi:hypothetical protein